MGYLDRLINLINLDVGPFTLQIQYALDMRKMMEKQVGWNGSDLQKAIERLERAAKD